LSKEVSVSDLEWEDKWIISKLNVTVKSVTAEIDKFKFSEPVTYLYRFFWNDLCDWYLEMIKPRMHDDARRPIAQKIFVYVLDHALKLLHPFMPFITEGIYQQLNRVAADRQIAGLKPIGQNDLLANSLWPTFNDEMVSDTIEAEMTQLQNIIRLVREVRANYNLGLKEPYTVSVKCSNDIATLIANQGRLACIMANLTSITAGETLQKPDNAAVTISDAMEIYVHDAVDVEAELKKLTKQKEKIQGFVANTEKKLGNENFVSRAKPEIVQRERDLVADLIKQLATIDKNINDLSK
jgi:valyl-tRNA synthetase